MTAQILRAREEKTLNLVEQMTRAITAQGTSSPSERKTAVSFLSGYIKKGYNKYIDEKKEEFPDKITIHVEDWVGQTADGSDANRLYEDFSNHMNRACENALANIDRNAPKKKMIFAGVAAVAAIVTLCLGLWPVAIIAAIVGIVNGVKIPSAKKEIDTCANSIRTEYWNRTEAGKAKIYAVLQQWYEARKVVAMYQDSPVDEIIA